MFSWEELSFFTSTVRFPVRLHPETIACTNLEVAKIFVNVNVSNELPKEIEFSKDDKEFTVAYHYPWLSACCNTCEKWGHTDKVCVLNGNRKKQIEGVACSLSVGSGVKEVRSESTSSTGVDEIRVQEVGTNEEKLEEGTKKREEKEVVKVQESVGVNNWSRVSPARVGRPQMRTPQRIETEVQISASKYSVLSLEEAVGEGEILIEEHEINDDYISEAREQARELEGDLFKDDILAQQFKEKDKAVTKKGVRRNQKAKAEDANPVKSTRPS